MLNQMSIRRRLFLVYTFVIVTAMTAVSVLYAAYTSRGLKESAYGALSQSAANAAAQLEIQVQELDLITTKIIMSQTIRENFYSEPDPARLREISDIVYSIMGPLSLGWQINLISRDGTFAAVGEYAYSMQYAPEALEGMDWLEAAFEAEGSRVVSLPHHDYWHSGERQVISVARSFGRDFIAPQDSVVEVQLDYKTLEEKLESLFMGSGADYLGGSSVYLADTKGRLIYPAGPEAEEELEQYWKLLAVQDSDMGTGDVGNQTLAYHTSDYTGWTVLVVLPQQVLLKNMHTFLQTVLATYATVIAVCILISYLMARSMTRPIRSMFHSIHTMGLSELLPNWNQRVRRTANELELLDDTFQEMRARLHESIAATVAIRSRETEARMVALQAQMNPHMLYNTISNIYVLAEESGEEKIMEMCASLNRMFRYILSDTKRTVTLQEEFQYAQSYLSLMRIRYGNLLECHVEMPEELAQVAVPKLIVQPMVENCIKHGTGMPAPWKIGITGVAEQTGWVVRIQDNGPGFSPEFLKSWEEIRDSEEHPYGGGKTNGMGLHNSWQRLQLLLGKAAVFRLFNLSEGGACVLFGSLDTEAEQEEMSFPG